jgi:hypothetical protein
MPDEITDLQSVMRVIEVLLEEFAAEASIWHRSLIPNALLNLAVNRMLVEETRRSTAAILYRLAELIADGARPQGSDAFALNGHDA